MKGMVVTPIDDDEEAQLKPDDDEDSGEIDVDALEESLQEQNQSQQPQPQPQQQLQQGTHQKIRICCPLTKQPLVDPAVHPDGNTYELEALKDNFAKVKWYPNRALKDYLDADTDARLELQDSLDKKGIFYCSITADLLRDPVIDPEGNTYERRDIVQWIKDNGKSPLTNSALKVDQLYDNTTLLTVLFYEIQQADVSLNREEIEDWIKEVSRCPQAEPALSGDQLKEALSNVPNPSLALIREALGDAPPSNVPNPPLAVIRQALEESEEEEVVPVVNRDEEDPAEEPQQRQSSTRSNRRSSRRSSSTRSTPTTEPEPLLFQELNAMRQSERSERQMNQQADEQLGRLIRRNRMTIGSLVVLVVGVVVAVFVTSFVAFGLDAPIAFIVSTVVVVCCCVLLGQCSLASE